MKRTGSRFHRFLRRGWLAGLAATSLSLATHAQSPTFTTRGSTSTADSARSAKPIVNLAAVESWLNGTKIVQDEATDMAPGTITYGNNGYANGRNIACNNGCHSGGILHNSYLFAADNAWRGPLDEPSNNSFGLVGGLNSGVPMPRKHGIGFQFGASYGIYDVHGRDDFGPESEPSSSEDQVFVTAGFFHRSVSCCECASVRDPISWGAVYDYMNTDNTGAAAAELRLGQVRAQIGYAC